MARIENWNAELRTWLSPFLQKLGHKARRQMCPLYLSGLIGPGDRKSVQPMAERFAPGDYDQLHHFVAAGVWDATPLETELLVQADRLVGGSDAVLVVDDTAMPKKGTHSVGVAPQYASALGKTANCQTLVSLTLARGEVPVMVALRLFLPENWTSDLVRLKRAGVPAEYQTARTKPEIALAEIDRVMAAGVRFGSVLADAGYGLSAPFRQALTARSLAWAVGIPRHLKVYPVGVKLIWPKAARGRPRKRHIPDILSVAAEDMLADAGVANCELAKRHEGPAESPLCRCPCAYRRRTAAADQGHGSTTHAGRRGLADRRTADVGREEILSGQSIGQDRPAHISRHNQSAMDLRTGPSAAEGGTWPRPLRGTILARASSSRAHDDDSLRLPPASPPHKNEAGKKESTDHHLNQAYRPCATPSSSSSLDCRLSDARTADDGSAPSRRMNKSAKVVLVRLTAQDSGRTFDAGPWLTAAPRCRLHQRESVGKRISCLNSITAGRQCARSRCGWHLRKKL